MDLGLLSMSEYLLPFLRKFSSSSSSLMFLIFLENLGSSSLLLLTGLNSPIYLFPPSSLAVSFGSSKTIFANSPPPAAPPLRPNSSSTRFSGLPYCMNRSYPSKLVKGLRANVTISCTRCWASESLRKSETSRRAAGERRSSWEAIEIR